MMNAVGHTTLNIKAVDSIYPERATVGFTFRDRLEAAHTASERGWSPNTTHCAEFKLNLRTRGGRR
jgi:hypothetical protein